MNERERLIAELLPPELALHPSRGSGFIDREVMVELVVNRGWTKAAAAEFFEVSGAAVTRAFQRMEIAVAKNIPAQQAGQALMTAQLSDSGARLASLAEQAQYILDLVSVVIKTDENAEAGREARYKLRRLAGPKGSLGDLAVKLLGESRKQLEFIFAMQREAFNMKRVEEFQGVVMDEIKAAAPEVQQRIMARLVQVQAFRSSLDIPGGNVNFAQD
ncbi:MAG: hypothetical protein RDU24_11620 [Humidesulfovibrio sp.]|uniref:hypothetical protein n=1 Tax=Humidesulfovibrio sp. TaxID=2910988 RepID=UPI0027F8515F|nr:hypothetical protein [Humidesulfovibrio sp.]MDQ7836021.1 hypothetical protein [Humidesulfovibrio sp.]